MQRFAPPPLPRAHYRATALARASLSAAIALVLATGPAASASDDPARAVHRDLAIPLVDVARYHCHDGAYPVIRCFDTAEERDGETVAPGNIDPSVSGEGADGDQTVAAVFYVSFWEHEKYGGASYSASQPNPSLGDYGWNDKVTSFKSLNGQRPKWWEHANYGPPAWQWAAGAWISNVGSGANDTFSSVKNVP